MRAIRSLLFVPGDSARKLLKARDTAADALILDLEDSVAPDRKDAARTLVGAALGEPGPPMFVRINALDTPDAAHDLAAAVQGRAFGIMLPKCRGAPDLRRLHDMLTVLEARERLATGSTVVLPIVTETGAAMLGAATYAEPGIPRLFGMAWGGEDLAADLGARTNRDEAGGYALPYQLARSTCLFAAAAAGTVPIDAVFTDPGDPDGLEREARAASRAGFVAKMAIHPAQAEIINRAFTPDDADIDHARRVLDAFAVSASAGVAVLDGRMLDRPHRRAAERVLAAADHRHRRDML